MSELATHTTQIRLPMPLYKRLKACAKRNLRSINSEMILAISRYIDAVTIEPESNTELQQAQE